MYIYVDTTVEKALALGAKMMYPATDMCVSKWQSNRRRLRGDRSAALTFPDGNVWFISKRIEDLDNAELQRRGPSSIPNNFTCHSESVGEESSSSAQCLSV